MTLNPEEARASTWLRHIRPVSGKPWSSTTGRPSPAVSKWTSIPPLSMITLIPLGPGPAASARRRTAMLRIPRRMSTAVTRREVHGDARIGPGHIVGPTGGDRLEPGVEPDALHAMDVGVAEEGLL